MKPIDWERLTPDQTRKLLDRADDEVLRQWYEYDAGTKGLSSLCSEKSVIDTVIRMLSEHLSEFETVLDIGCGFNLVYDLFLESRGKKVQGIDLSQGFIDLAWENIRSKKSSIRVSQGSAKDLKFPDASFDAVILSETVEHIRDDKQAILEARRVLRGNGLLFFTVPNLFNYARLTAPLRGFNLNAMKFLPGHLREYTAGKVRKLLTPQFKIEKFYSVPMGYAPDSRGGFVDRLILKNTCGLRCVGKSIACAARKIP